LYHNFHDSYQILLLSAILSIVEGNQVEHVYCHVSMVLFLAMNEFLPGSINVNVISLASLKGRIMMVNDISYSILDHELTRLMLLTDIT